MKDLREAHKLLTIPPDNGYQTKKNGSYFYALIGITLSQAPGIFVRSANEPNYISLHIDYIRHQCGHRVFIPWRYKTRDLLDSGSSFDCHSNILKYLRFNLTNKKFVGYLN
jgi:hypothetical protein